MARRRLASLFLREGALVCGPRGWVVLPGDVRVPEARLDRSSLCYTYNVNGEPWEVGVDDCLVLGAAVKDSMALAAD